MASADDSAASISDPTDDRVAPARPAVEAAPGPPPTRAELEECLRVLRAVGADRGALAILPEEVRLAFEAAADRVICPTIEDKRKLSRAFRRNERAEIRAHDALLVRTTINRSARTAAGYIQAASTAEAQPLRLPPLSTGIAATGTGTETMPSASGAGSAPPELLRPRACYVCKDEYTRLHFFYDALCPACAALNWQKRHQTAPLQGKVAILTGGRIKIGYQAALILLRAGAEVIVTSRFPQDSAERYAQEPDFADWSSRLRVVGLDLLDLPSVERFGRHMAGTLPRLDYLINNAAQTVRRPPAFYDHLREREARPRQALPEAVQAVLEGGRDARSPVLMLHAATSEELVRSEAHFPRGAFDLDAQQIDQRPVNSWRMTLTDVPTVELVEVHLVNAVAPGLLAARLKPLLARDPLPAKHVINVSAMEASFSRGKKTERHPHTNMAKASLNMLTRTAANEYARDRIYMNSVDTGWVTDEDPLHHVARKQEEHDFHPPLDAIDGAARVLDPIFLGEATGDPPVGRFFKDYALAPW